jgi:hypothetical protein
LEGCFETGYAVANDRNIVLDFGAQVSDSSSGDGWGAQSPFTTSPLPDNSSNASVETVESATLAFLDGLTYCNDTMSAWVGIGTNNSGSKVNATAGSIWGQLVYETYLTYYNNSGDGFVTLRGANDIEPAWSSWSSAKQWIGGNTPALRTSSSGSGSGYQTWAGAVPYFDFGSADGCSYSQCANSWTQNQVYSAAYGYYGAIAMPEIYNPGVVADWQVVSQDNPPGIYYSTALSEHAQDSSTYTAAEAWQELWSISSQSGISISSSDIAET